MTRPVLFRVAITSPEMSAPAGLDRLRPAKKTGAGYDQVAGFEGALDLGTAMDLQGMFRHQFAEEAALDDRVGYDRFRVEDVTVFFHDKAAARAEVF
jgi:hypothetical protein